MSRETPLAFQKLTMVPLNKGFSVQQMQLTPLKIQFTEDCCKDE
jgi:hypothetical protein